MKFLYSKSEFITAFVAVAIMSVVIIASIILGMSARDEIARYRNNEIALVAENDSLRNRSVVYELSINQLQYINDSISRKIENVLDELGVQKRRLAQVQYIDKITEIRDTVILRDSVFVKRVDMDTVVTDGRFYTIGLGLHSPNVITVNPSIREELYVVMENRKETVDKPRKCFVARWFQRKRIVVEATVHTDNPYVEIQNSRFVKVVK